MKQLVCISLAFTLLWAVEGVHSQENHFVYISAQFKNHPLKDVLHQIEDKYAIRFSYLDQAVENKRITTAIKSKPLSDALKLILQGTSLIFQIFDSKDVVIFKKTINERYSIQGRVVEKEDGQGIPFANVVIPSLGSGDATDDNGYYKIENLPADIYNIRFQVIGYKPFSKKVDLVKNTNLNAKLEIQAIELAAVEITPGIIQISSEEPSTHILGSEEILSSANFQKRCLSKHPDIAGRGEYGPECKTTY